MSEEPSAAYDRGLIAGEIAARLRGHDEHLAQINGNMGDVAKELQGVNLQLQRLADQAQAREVAAVATAKALKEAEEARRANTEQAWSPLQRLYLVLVVALALIGLFSALWAAFRPH